MRVIAGDFKGRRLQSVPNKLTRPTSDKVKESLFNRIGPFFDGGLGLDLFAGSGNLGIEALSRGLDRVIFVDQQKLAIQVIKQNLKQLNIDRQAEVYHNDAFRALKAVAKRELVFQYIFLDPPYQKVSYQKLLLEISKYPITDHSTLIICEHDLNNVLPETLACFKQFRSERYGATTAITVYRSVTGGL
nr:16S rRNA (guanine(966)-N(2))-methyltransferase RsmD [Amphibacillus sediminis]